MQARIIQLEAELTKKNHELEAVRAEYGARFASIESKLPAVCQNEGLLGSAEPAQPTGKCLSTNLKYLRAS